MIIELNASLILSTMLGSLLGFGIIGVFTALVLLANKTKLDTKFQTYLAKRLQQEREQFGPEIQARVTQGVSDGIADGIAAIPSTQVLKRTRQTMAKTGREIVGSGFQSLFGKRPMDAEDTAPPGAPIIETKSISEPPPN